MKFPVCNVDLLVGERLTLQMDCYQKIRGIWFEKDKLDIRIETAFSSIDRLGRDSAAIFGRIG
jgi:Zn-finger nucleic acid-binding protein